MVKRILITADRIGDIGMEILDNERPDTAYLVNPKIFK